MACLLFLAGCFTPAKDATTPTPPADIGVPVLSNNGDPASNRSAAPPVSLTDNMTLVYRTEDGKPTRIVVRATNLLDSYGQTVPGHVVRVETPDGWTFRFGLGPCLTPLWTTQDEDYVWFASAGDASYFVDFPAFLLLRNATIPKVSEFSMKQLAHVPLNGTDYVLAVGTDGEKTYTGWVLHFRKNPDVYRLEGKWFEEPVQVGQLPRWIAGGRTSGTAYLDLINSTLTGGPLLSCHDFSPTISKVDQQPLSTRATFADPPAPWSLHEMIAYAESNTQLQTLQEWKNDPNVAIYEWQGKTLSGLQDYSWTILYGNPVQHQALSVECDHTPTSGVTPPNPVTVQCQELQVPQDNLRPLPSTDFSHATIISYESLFALYRGFYDSEPCTMKFTLDPLARPTAPGYIAPAADLACDAGPRLVVRADVQEMQGLVAPLPKAFLG